MSRDYRSFSYWLETCGDDLTPRPALDESLVVDVAILGAGYSGLWTAYYLKERDPSLRVVILEAEVAGFGASGRNGGWCVCEYPVSPAKLRERHGREDAARVMRHMFEAVSCVGQVCEREGIDAHYLKSGAIELARAEHQLDVLREEYTDLVALGLDAHYQLLDADTLASHVRVRNGAGGILLKEGATVQPARLARGLARAVEQRGVTIYEQTRVAKYVPGPLPRLDTERGNVVAKTVVLAGEAYLSGLPGLRRQIIPMTSHIVLTEPLPDDVWREIGWERREVIGGMGTFSGYLNKTVDGRIAFGPYRSVYPYGSRVTDALDQQASIFAHARKAALDWFPALRDAQFTHGWGGVFGIPRDRTPTIAYDRLTGVATARGYVGVGVALSNLAGRILADLITETDSDAVSLPIVGHRSRDWEPEPVRWAGVNYVRRSLLRREAKAERTGHYPERRSLAQRFWES